MKIEINITNKVLLTLLVIFALAALAFAAVATIPVDTSKPFHMLQFVSRGAGSDPAASLDSFGSVDPISEDGSGSPNGRVDYADYATVAKKAKAEFTVGDFQDTNSLNCVGDTCVSENDIKGLNCEIKRESMMVALTYNEDEMWNTCKTGYYVAGFSLPGWGCTTECNMVFLCCSFPGFSG